MRTTSYITGYPLDYAEKIFMSSTVKPFGYLKKPFQMELLKLYVERLSKGKAKHGFGMEIIEHITKFYEGTVSTNYDNQFFTIVIQMNLPIQTCSDTTPSSIQEVICNTSKS